MTNRQRIILIVIIVLLVVMVPLGGAVLFTVDEREVAVVLQFGEPVASYTEPGLKFKMPFVQEVRKLPKAYQFWSGAGMQVLEDLPTADGKRIEVSAWAVWRITDPKTFVEVLRTVENAELRVATFVKSETRNVITSNDLVEVVRSTDRDRKYPMLTKLLQILAESETDENELEREPEPGPDTESGLPLGQEDEGIEEWILEQTEAKVKIKVGRQKIVQQINDTVQTALFEGGEGEQSARGIELVDVGVSRIDLVPTVREAAFKRQITRWESIASFYTNQGEKRKQQILNRTQARVEEILGEGQKQANEIKGEVDARIIDAYAAAINETGEFYNFIRTLEAYETAIGENTRLILTTDGSLLRLLKDVGESNVSPKTEAAPQ
jgi:membrane protease subunit HflC